MGHDVDVSLGQGRDLEKKFSPSLLNTAIYLLGLSQQVSTFVLNFQGRPFREGIRENMPLYWGLVGVSAVAYSGSTNFVPELNSWLQLVEMSGSVSFRFSASRTTPPESIADSSSDTSSR